MPEKWIGHLFHRWFDRISFNYSGAMFSGEGCRRPRQFLRDTLTAVTPLDEKTRDGPDRFIIDRLQDPRAFKPKVLFSRRNRAPAYRLVADVSEDSGRCPTRIHNFP